MLFKNDDCTEIIIVSLVNKFYNIFLSDGEIMWVDTASKREPGHLEGGLVGGRTRETSSSRRHTLVCRAVRQRFQRCLFLCVRWEWEGGGGANLLNSPRRMAAGPAFRTALSEKPPTTARLRDIRIVITLRVFLDKADKPKAENLNKSIV